ncbi:MAG: hypothetical protein C4293_06555 [Nitrospiraceae bacterium]
MNHHRSYPLALLALSFTVPISVSGEMTTQSPRSEMAGMQGTSTKEYLLLPVPQGELKGTEKYSLRDATVKDSDGRPLGTLERMVMDTETGKIEYGVLSLSADDRLVAIPWNAFKFNRESGNVRLNVTRDELNTYLSPAAAKDMSPGLQQVVREIEDVRGEMKRQGGGAGTTRPSTSSPAGESQTGAGTSETIR